MRIHGDRRPAAWMAGALVGFSLLLGCAGNNWNPFGGSGEEIDAHHDREAAQKRMSLRQSCIHMAALGRWDEALDVCEDAKRYYPNDHEIERAIADAEAERHL
jgi:hypothetical protein